MGSGHLSVLATSPQWSPATLPSTMVSVVWGHDRKYRYMGLYENTAGLLEKLPCTAAVSSSIKLDVCYMECSVACGKLEACGAYFVKEDSGYQCFLIEMDEDDNYKNKGNPTLIDSTSVKYFVMMSSEDQRFPQ